MGMLYNRMVHGKRMKMLGFIKKKKILKGQEILSIQLNGLVEFNVCRVHCVTFPYK